MKKLIAAVVFVALALASCVLSGCGSTPTAFEQKFFDITTNYTPQITIHTNTVTFTNVVQREQWTTNVVNDVKHITITPVREVTLKDVAVVTYQTNMEVSYTYTANTNAATISQTGGAIAAPFGFGGLVSTAITGIFGIWAAIRSRRKGQLAAGLSQGIEVLSEVLKTTPQGQVLDQRVKAWLQTNQVQAGTVGEVLKLLETVVDNEEARNIASRIRAELADRATPKAGTS